MRTAKTDQTKQTQQDISVAHRPSVYSHIRGQQPRRPTHISILGGGLAGLAVGYYARSHSLPFTIYEAANRTGGNCITLKHGDFRFDSGAHRFHDKDESVTQELRKLLGEDLEKSDLPGQIYHNGIFIDFPLSPLNLMMSLGLRSFCRAVLEVARSRLRKGRVGSDFESFAVGTYGNTIAQLFLLNYSQKLWGLRCHKLSAQAAVKRMKGLNLSTFITEAIFGKKVKTEHLEGSFYYPKMGIGAIAEKLTECCGREDILTNSKITKILHDHTRIQAVEVNAKSRISVDEVVSTLPLNHFLQMMEPSPPEDILALSRSLRFRRLILVTLFLDRASVTEAATVYFPSTDFPFTRVYEPRNRSACMSPSGRTSLVAEIPCSQQDAFCREDDCKLIETVRSRLVQIGWIKRHEIIDSAVTRMKYAYPVLEVDAEDKIRGINTFLDGFGNLTLSGRNGRFLHASIHEVIRLGQQAIHDLVSAPSQ